VNLGEWGLFFFLVAVTALGLWSAFGQDWVRRPYTVRATTPPPELDPLGEYVLCPRCGLMGRHELRLVRRAPEMVQTLRGVIEVDYIGPTRWWRRECLFDPEHTWTVPYREEWKP